MIRSFHDKTPVIGPEVYAAEDAEIIGDVTLEEGVSIWYGAVLRGDRGPIRVGEGSNIQDCCILHEAVTLGKNVTVGHGAILHGCTVGDGALIGMGSILLDGCVIGEGAMVAAGSLVPGGKQVPPYTLIMGSPAKPVREVARDENAGEDGPAALYRREARCSLPPAGK